MGGPAAPPPGLHQKDVRAGSAGDVPAANVPAASRQPRGGADRVSTDRKEGHGDTCDHMGELVEMAPVSPGTLLRGHIVNADTSGRHSRGPST